MSQDANQKGQPGMMQAAFFGLCPRCGQKTLFAHVARFAAKCPSCNLDYEGFNVGDGPAAFLTLGVGTLIIVLAILLDITARPPFWVHALIWVPSTAALTVLSLRMAKGMLLTIEYRRTAGEAGSSDLK